jgi:HD domain
MRDLVAWSVDIATDCLADAGLGQRWQHVQAVGVRAHQLRCTVADDGQDVLVAAAWLHDIGYAPKVAHSGLHSLDGARYLDRLGLPHRVCALVAHHTGARFEAAQRGLTTELAAYEREHGPVADALTAADLTTSPTGQLVSAEERIREILTRYPPASAVHQAITAARDFLLDTERRVTTAASRPTGPLTAEGHRPPATSSPAPPGRS